MGSLVMECGSGPPEFRALTSGSLQAHLSPSQTGVQVNPIEAPQKSAFTCGEKTKACGMTRSVRKTPLFHRSQCVKCFLRAAKSNLTLSYQTSLTETN